MTKDRMGAVHHLAIAETKIPLIPPNSRQKTNWKA